MSRMPVHWLLRVYPSAWCKRHGKELESLLDAGSYGPRKVFDVLRSALCERWSSAPNAGLPMSAYSGSFLSLSKRPSALLPMVMSVAALTAVVVSLARFGVPPPHTDEGATAHTWQLLMLFQVPGIAWFAFKWMRKTPRLALGVLGIQVGLALVAMAPVYILGL